MKTIRTTRRAFYRRAQIQSKNNSNLQSLLENSLMNLKTVKSRLETVDSSGNTYRLIAKHSKKGSMLAGHLISFERGNYQLVVGDDPSATSLELDAIEPPRQGETIQQFVTGVVYFCIFENYVALIQSSSLRASALERHLAWIIRDKAGVLGNTDGLALVDEPHKATAEKIRRTHIKRVSLGLPFMKEDAPFEASTSTGGNNPTPSRGEAQYKADRTLKGFFRRRLSEDCFSKLNLADVVFDGDLEVWLDIKHPKYQRNHPAKTTKLLDDLGIALRDQEENSVKIELRDGTTIAGSQLKISSPVDFEMIGGKPNIDSIYDALSGWINDLIRNDEISI